MFQNLHFNLLPAQAFDESFYNLLIYQKVDINSIPDKPVPFQCLLFTKNHEPQYHRVWYMHNLPDIDYTLFATNHIVLATEAISYWFKIDTPCPADLVLDVLLILSNQPRIRTVFEPRQSIWHMYSFIDQLLHSNAFQPVNQLYCVDLLQSWMHSNNANLVTCDPNAVVLQWLLKSECYVWKKEFVFISNLATLVD
jgi:hypothetical protein